MEYGLVLLARQPDIQREVREELLANYRKHHPSADPKDFEKISSEFTLDHLIELPLFRAMVHEITRVSVVVNRGLRHFTSDDMDVVIPKEISKSGKEENYRVKKGALTLSPCLFSLRLVFRPHL